MMGAVNVLYLLKIAISVKSIFLLKYTIRVVEKIFRPIALECSVV